VSGGAEHAGVIIEDDWQRASALASARKLPLFVDVWAPWCHTCRFMRATVLKDPAFMQTMGRFVWLSIDREKRENAPFLAKYASNVSPTYWVIDGASGAPALKWLGSATEKQLERLLEDGEHAIRVGDAKSADAVLAAADRDYAAGQDERAAEGYREALRAAAPGWTRHGRAVESLLFALHTGGKQEACAQAARSEVPRLDRGPSFGNAAVTGLQCALSAARGAQWADDAIAELEPMVTDALALDGILADDRSGFYESLVEARQRAGDEAAAKRLAEEWLSFLEGEAARAPNPEARAVFDPHRVSAALILGQAQRVVGAVEQSERDLPNDFNPAARLCTLYRELGRFEDAEKACGRALARADGPRRLRVLETLAKVYASKGDQAAARRTIEDALRFGDTLPASQRPVGALERLRKQLE
jgi:tetratricopeptide (TPR) repeat protein